MEKLILYTDGGARGNPGPAGAGAVVYNCQGETLTEMHHALGEMTNNEAEYQALLLGLETIKKLVGKEKTRETEIEARLDSELVAKQLNGEYQIKEASLQPLFIKVWNQRVAHFPKLTFQHIPREQNRRADELANQAMDEAQAVSVKKPLF